MSNDIVIERRFGGAIKGIRSAIAAAELEIAAELDLNGTSACRLLLVDCVWTDVEALALDAAAAVFLPLHVLVTGDGQCTRISSASAAGLIQARLPPGASVPIQRLEARIAGAMGSISVGLPEEGASIPILNG